MKKMALLLGVMVLTAMVLPVYCQETTAPVEVTKVNGTIDKIDTLKSEIVVKELLKSTTLAIAPLTKITLVDGNEGKLTDLKVGDTVEAEVSLGKTISVEVVPPVVK